MYEIYSDESGKSGEKFRSIGTLSGLPLDINNLRAELTGIQNKFNIKHCEFKDVSGGKNETCAQEMLEVLVRFVIQKKIKIIILTWNILNTRNSIAGRNDIANLERMYYRILKNTKRIWLDSGIDSSFYADEHMDIDFNSIIYYLERTNLTRDIKVLQTLFGKEFNINFPKVKDHKQIVSTSDPVLQGIDLMTGLGRLSHEEYESYEKWKFGEHSKIQSSFFESFVSKPNFSKRKVYKYRLICFLDERFKHYRMQISLKTNKRFLSNKPSCGIWFWTYEPQGAYDKAPTSINI